MAFSTLFTFSGPPQWWIDRGVIVAGAEENNHGAVSVGQAKWMATQAHAELTEQLAPFGGIGFPIDDLFPAPGTPDAAWYEQQKAALNIGQLKHIAAPFYDRLHEISPAFLARQAEINEIDWADGQIYPWSDDTPLEENYKLANIGQLKSVFAFQTRVDTDGDSVSDFLELQNGSNPLDPGDGGSAGPGPGPNPPGTGGPDDPPTDSDGDGVPDSLDGWALCPQLSPERKDPPKYAVIELVDIPSGAWINNFEINNDLKAIFTVYDTDNANYKNYYYGNGALKNLDSLSESSTQIKIGGLSEEGYFLQYGQDGQGGRTKLSLFWNGEAHHEGLSVKGWPYVFPAGNTTVGYKKPTYGAYCVGPGGTVYGRASYFDWYEYEYDAGTDSDGKPIKRQELGSKHQEAGVIWTSENSEVSNSFIGIPRLSHYRDLVDYSDPPNTVSDNVAIQGLTPQFGTTFIKGIFVPEVADVKQEPLIEIIQSNEHGVNLAIREQVNDYWSVTAVDSTGYSQPADGGGDATRTLGYMIGSEFHPLGEEITYNEPTTVSSGISSRSGGFNNRNTILTNSSEGVTMWIDSQLGHRHNQTPQGNPSYQKLVWDEAWGPEPPLNLNADMRGFSEGFFYLGVSSRLWFNAAWHSILGNSIPEKNLIDSEKYTWIKVHDINDNDALAAELTKTDGKKVAALLIPVEFITPAGDPVKKPVDQPWAAGAAPVDGANEFTFNDASPGVLEINLKVKIPGIGGMPANIQNKFLFEVDAIGNSQMQWDATNAGGKPTFNGDFMTAKVKFTGLPQNNSDFGQKMTRIKFDGEVASEQAFEVFYAVELNSPGRIKNHPGGNKAVWDNQNLSTKQGEVPNWYYYWGQLDKVKDYNIVFGGYLVDAEVPAAGLAWSYHKKIDKTLMVIGNKGGWDADRAYDVGEFKSGIDFFVAAVLHESVHIEQIRKADLLLPTNGNDTFRYGWSYGQLSHNHWNKGKDGAWGEAGKDDESLLNGGDGIVDNAKAIPSFEPGNGDDEDLGHPKYRQWPKVWPLPNPMIVKDNPAESEAVNFEDAQTNEHDFARQDWGNPGKNHKTIDKWND